MMQSLLCHLCNFGSGRCGMGFHVHIGSEGRFFV